MIQKTSELSALQLHHGPPETLEGRQEREKRVYSLLDRLCIEYERVDHPAAATMEACEAVDEVLNVRICKNLFLCNRQETQFFLLVMPADKPFHTKDFSKQVNSSRLSFAKAEHMIQFLDLYPGSASVLGLMNDAAHHVHLAIDEDVLKEKMFACHPCVNTSSLRFKTDDLIHIILPSLHITPSFVTLPSD
jgi:Ala-tRNA(Pro) deacylase